MEMDVVKMASRSLGDVCKLVNSINHYSHEDQQAITAVIEDYFTTGEDNNEDFDFDSNGKCSNYTLNLVYNKFT